MLSEINRFVKRSERRIAKPLLTLAASGIAFVSINSGIEIVPPLYQLTTGNFQTEQAKLDPIYAVSQPLIDRRIPAPNQIREEVFEWFNIKPEAREWLGRLPLGTDYNSRKGTWGTYDTETEKIDLSVPFLDIFLHEFAHANFDRIGLINRALFRIHLIRLMMDDAPNVQSARGIVDGVSALVAKSYSEGGEQSFTNESYAYLAQFSGGNLNTLPRYLQPYYDRYLQPGENKWTTYQHEAALGRIQKVR